MFQPNYEVSHLVGASYNPRKISDDGLAKLQESIRILGMVKPIIITESGVTVAGHQRTKALLANGEKYAPVFVLEKPLTVTAEIFFNQLHNGTDLDTGKERCRIPTGQAFGYSYVPANRVDANFRSPGAGVRAEVAKLLINYGNWGGAVATMSGEVLSGAPYAMACRAINMPPRIYYVPDEQRDLILELFGTVYGEFDYSQLPTNTSLQTFAQLYRLRNASSPKLSESYERWVIPALEKAKAVGRELRVLDFGCGQGDYVRHLAKRGFDIRGVEFFFRSGANIDTRAVHHMIDEVCHNLETHGLFDLVICDFVLNSVTNQTAHDDVLYCLSALAKVGAPIFWSGRLYHERWMGSMKSSAKSLGVEFTDANGYRATYRKGGWFFQKFHDRGEVESLNRKFFSTQYETRCTESKFMFKTKRTVIHPVEVMEAALSREFDLPWPAGRRVGRATEILKAWRIAHARELGE